MKYITYMNKKKVPDIRLFSDRELHKNIADEMQSRYPFELLGAGFVIAGKCGGRSESLGLNSRGLADTTVLEGL